MYNLTTNSEMILRLSDNAWIPPHPLCRDYQEYLLWLEAGNTPDPAPEPPAPQELTAQEKLEAAGLTIEELKGLLGL